MRVTAARPPRPARPPFPFLTAPAHDVHALLLEGSHPHLSSVVCQLQHAAKGAVMRMQGKRATVPSKGRCHPGKAAQAGTAAAGS